MEPASMKPWIFPATHGECHSCSQVKPTWPPLWHKQPSSVQLQVWLWTGYLIKGSKLKGSGKTNKQKKPKHQENWLEYLIKCEKPFLHSLTANTHRSTHKKHQNHWQQSWQQYALVGNHGSCHSCRCPLTCTKTWFQTKWSPPSYVHSKAQSDLILGYLGVLCHIPRCVLEQIFFFREMHTVLLGDQWNCRNVLIKILESIKDICNNVIIIKYFDKFHHISYISPSLKLNLYNTPTLFSKLGLYKKK